ncbi:aminotransferase class V-fold PLP-dependent enzyme [Nonomuraea sp. NPDC050310]|uniref:cysteine desulfurase family protein n=1 Tax=unclassified Nonomuraea TaxID=2593643 RepID=UPI0033DBF046
MAYFDAASTEPLHPAAREAYLSALGAGWADPARLYGPARRARLLLEQSRAEIAELLGARADELSFPSSGTHAVHLGILGALAGRRRVGERVVASAVEHSSVLHAAPEAALVPVSLTGRADVAAFAEAVAVEGTALACLQTANHEVGTLQPVAEVAEACRAAGVPLMVDACVTAGRLPIPAGWSVLAASAHKWGGPAGVGVLAVRKGTRFRSPYPEDDRGRVPGFPDVPAVAAAAAALRAVSAEAAAENARLAGLVDLIRDRVPKLIPDVEVIGEPVERAPHIVTFSCLYVDGEALLTELDRLGFAVSSGSSCTASTLRPSHVLEAMGVLTHGNVRVSLPRGASRDDVERFLASLPEVVRRIRLDAGVS